MTRTHPLIAVGGLVLLLSASVFMSGSMIVADETETILKRVAADSVVQSAVETQEETGRDAAIAAIKRLGGRLTVDGQSNLTQLDLDSTKLTDAELKHLKGLTNLRSLRLSRTQVTDAGLEHLKGMTELSSLYLYETVVSDAGLENLKGLTKLKFLMLKRTNVTDAGAKKLQQALPDCLISHSPLNPRSAQIGVLAGRWSVEFANGVKQTCEIREDETASVVEPGRTSGGQVGVQNRAIVIAYDDNRVERWTLVGKRLVVEHWAPVPGPQRWAGHPPLRPLPTSTPVLGIAERAQ